MIKLPPEVLEIKEKQDGEKSHGGGGGGPQPGAGASGRGGHAEQSERKGDLTFEDIQRLQQKLRQGKGHKKQLSTQFYQEEEEAGVEDRRVFDNQQEFNFEDEGKGVQEDYFGSSRQERVGLSSGAAKQTDYAFRKEKKSAPAAEFDLLGVSGASKQPKQKKEEGGASFWGGFEPQQPHPQKSRIPPGKSAAEGGGEWFAAKDA